MSDYMRCLEHAASAGMPADAAAKACRDEDTRRCLAYLEGGDADKSLDNLVSCYGSQANTATAGNAGGRRV